jgi:hypothetical protein
MRRGRMENHICYKKKPDIVSRVVGDELILIPLQQQTADIDSIFATKEVGARIWGLINGKTSIEMITDKICSEFDVSLGEAAKDIVDFLDLLEKKGFIIPCPS